MTVRLFLALISLLLCTATAQAGLILGIAPDPSASLDSRTAAELLTGYLGRQLDDAVELRIFRNQDTLLRWLARYREVDLALLPRQLYAQQQDDLLVHLVDFVPRRPLADQAVTTLVARPGLAPDLLQRLHNLLLVMDTEPVGAKFIAGYNIEQYPSPQTRIPLSPATQVQHPVPPSAPAKIPAKGAATLLPKALPAPVPQTVQRQASAPAKARPHGDPPAVPRATSEPVQPTAAPQETAQKPPSPPPVQAVPPVPPTVGGIETDSHLRPRLLWIILIILSCGLLIKLLLLVRGRPRSRSRKHAPHLLIQHDWAELQGALASPEPLAGARHEPAPRRVETLQAKLKEADQPKPEKASAPAVAPDMSLGGQLTSSQVPSLLHYFGTSHRVGTLVVRSQFNEKRISFCRGKIVAASSVNLSNQNQSGFLMNKLGYLLVRQGKISEDDRDRALVLCEGDANLRLGEALIRLGVIRREQLQHSLQDQAKMVLHSMIVFPEGEFQFTPEQTTVPQRDSLEISVAEFLKEAATHQGEWRSIRQLIPSLDCVLRFAPAGRDKINNSRMTVHQKFVLSLIDGQRRIREICNEATMLDYELYRFLYLMVKADILQLAD